MQKQIDPEVEILRDLIARRKKEEKKQKGGPDSPRHRHRLRKEAEEMIAAQARAEANLSDIELLSGVGAEAGLDTVLEQQQEEEENEPLNSADDATMPSFGGGGGDGSGGSGLCHVEGGNGVVEPSRFNLSLEEEDEEGDGSPMLTPRDEVSEHNDTMSSAANSPMASPTLGPTQ